jgi:integrase
MDGGLMASVSITRRRAALGVRYVVRYRLGGRAYPLVHGGSFTRERDAKTRRDFIAGELAAWRNPAIALRAIAVAPVRRTLREEFEKFRASRVDVGLKAQKLYKKAEDRLRSLADVAPDEITAAQVQAWIAENSETSEEYAALSPKSLGHYLSTLRQVLDFCDVTPNPARSPLVKLPAQTTEEVNPPSAEEWAAIRATVSPRLSLLVRFIECLGLRVSEALKLTYGDVDFANRRVRISRARTKGRTAGQRWLDVPNELLGEIAELVPLEDRHRDRLVFPRITDVQVRNDIYRACRSLRSRRIPRTTCGTADSRYGLRNSLTRCG